MADDFSIQGDYRSAFTSAGERIDNMPVRDASGSTVVMRVMRDEDGTVTACHRNLALEAQVGRLVALLGLTPEERSFVRAALEPGQTVDFFLVLADYLEEQGRQQASARFRKMGEAK